MQIASVIILVIRTTLSSVCRHFTKGVAAECMYAWDVSSTTAGRG